jgi:pyruvate kinase
VRSDVKPRIKLLAKIEKPSAVEDIEGSSV